MSGGAFARYRAGEEVAASVAVADYGAAAYAAANGVLRDAAAAESVASTVLIDGLREARPPDGGAAAERVWVVARARASAIARTRTPKKGRFGRSAPPDPTPPAAPEAALGLAVDAGVAHSGFASLPLAQRDVLSLAYGSGLDAAEIARRKGYSVGEARDVLRRGLEAMQRLLAEGAV